METLISRSLRSDEKCKDYEKNNHEKGLNRSYMTTMKLNKMINKFNEIKNK